jgi:hypothetical protein
MKGISELICAWQNEWLFGSGLLFGQEPGKSDNTGVNKRDRNKIITADQQKQNSQTWN